MGWTHFHQLQNQLFQVVKRNGAGCACRQVFHCFFVLLLFERLKAGKSSSDCKQAAYRNEREEDELVGDCQDGLSDSAVAV